MPQTSSGGLACWREEGEEGTVRVGAHLAVIWDRLRRCMLAGDVIVERRVVAKPV
jgi:hypothetical protein